MPTTYICCRYLSRTDFIANTPLGSWHPHHFASESGKPWRTMLWTFRKCRGRHVAVSSFGLPSPGLCWRPRPFCVGGAAARGLCSLWRAGVRQDPARQELRLCAVRLEVGSHPFLCVCSLCFHLPISLRNRLLSFLKNTLSFKSVLLLSKTLLSSFPALFVGLQMIVWTPEFVPWYVCPLKLAVCICLLVGNGFVSPTMWYALSIRQ
jgi:hypothetical protein